MMLKTVVPEFYKVKRGQSVKDVAAAFCLPESAIVACNDLRREVHEGQILRIPRLREISIPSVRGIPSGSCPAPRKITSAKT